MSLPVFNVLIIGAGKIGAHFDTPDSTDVWTHAHAFSQSPTFKLLGFLDPDITQAQSAITQWGGEVFDSIDTAFKQHSVDVVCIASPDETHADILQALLSYSPKLVFCEKPLTTELGQAKKLVVQYQQQNIPLLVNYTRRFVPEFQQLQSNIKSDLYGKFVGGNSIYGKGFKHNGSHLIDLLYFLIGDIDGVQPAQEIHDFTSNDPSISVLLTLENQPFWVQAMDSRLYTIFEMDLFFEHARIQILDSGFHIQISVPAASANFNGYQNLKQTQTIQTSLNQAMVHAADHITAHLTQNKPLLCSGEEALKTLAVCHSAKLQAIR